MNAHTTPDGLKQRLKRDEPIFGTMIVEFFSAGVPSLVASSGADFVLYDMEHSGISLETIRSQVAGCRGLPIAPFIRVPAGEYHFVSRALDIGAHGIMVPMVETRDEAEDIVSFGRYPSLGRRGAMFSAAHDDYSGGSIVEKIKRSNERNVTICQIESELGLANVEEIAAVDGVDMLWLGQLDLANFLGVPGQFDGPVFENAVKRISNAARKNNIAAAVLVADEASGRRYWDLGFRVIAYGLDHLVYQKELTAGIANLRSIADDVPPARPV